MVGLGLANLGAHGAPAGIGGSLGFVHHVPLGSSGLWVGEESSLLGGRRASSLNAVHLGHRGWAVQLKARGRGSEERPASRAVLRATETTRSSELTNFNSPEPKPEGLQLNWSDGSSISTGESLVTLAAAVASIPILQAGLDLMRYADNFMVVSPKVAALAQLSVCITILMAGIPSFRKFSVFAVSQTAILAAFTGMTSMDDPIPFAILAASFFSSAYWWSKGNPTELERSIGPVVVKETESLVSSSAPGIIDDVEIEDPGDIHLTMWEKTYGLQPARDRDPRNWSVQDLSAELIDAKLDDCVEALKKAKVDGRVAMTFTSKDESELKEELKLSLSQRRRLLMYLEGLRDSERETDSDN